MKKVSCPVCKNKWDEDYKLGFTVGSPLDNFRTIICHMKLKDFVFCPVCFFSTKEDDSDPYGARLDRVVLESSGVKIEAVVVRDELGRYLEVPIDKFKEIQLSGFQPYADFDDDGSTMATDSWGGAGPDCNTKPE